jgi:hypothetical protein
MQLNYGVSGFKKIGMLLIGLIFLGLAGCVQNTDDLIAPILSTQGLEYNERIPLNDDFDGCLGERITITGDQHIVGRFTKDGKGLLHFGFTRNTHGTGLGQISGDTYLLTDTVNRSSFESVAGEPRVFLEHYQSHLIHLSGNTANDDAILHFLSKITIDANGNITSVVELKKAECK